MTWFWIWAAFDCIALTILWFLQRHERRDLAQRLREADTRLAVLKAEREMGSRRDDLGRENPGYVGFFKAHGRKGA